MAKQMRDRQQIEKEFITVGGGFMMKTEDKAKTLNPKLQLEVLLDIRDLLKQLVEGGETK